MENSETQSKSEQLYEKREREKENLKDDKLWAVLSYLGILVLIPLLGKKESAFVQFHAKQGLIMLFGWIVSWFPVFGWAIGIVMFVFSVIGIVNVLNGEKKKLPMVGDLAEKINL